MVYDIERLMVNALLCLLNCSIILIGVNLNIIPTYINLGISSTIVNDIIYSQNVQINVLSRSGYNSFSVTIFNDFNDLLYFYFHNYEVLSVRILIIIDRGLIHNNNLDCSDIDIIHIDVYILY